MSAEDLRDPQAHAHDTPEMRLLDPISIFAVGSGSMWAYVRLDTPNQVNLGQNGKNGR